MDRRPIPPRPTSGRRAFCRLHVAGGTAPLTAVVVEVTACGVGLYLPSSLAGGQAMWLEPEGATGPLIPVRVRFSRRLKPGGFLANCDLPGTWAGDALRAWLGGP